MHAHINYSYLLTCSCLSAQLENRLLHKFCRNLEELLYGDCVDLKLIFAKTDLVFVRNQKLYKKYSTTVCDIFDSQNNYATVECYFGPSIRLGNGRTSKMCINEHIQKGKNSYSFLARHTPYHLQNVNFEGCFKNRVPKNIVYIYILSKCYFFNCLLLQPVD